MAKLKVGPVGAGEVAGMLGLLGSPIFAFLGGSSGPVLAVVSVAVGLCVFAFFRYLRWTEANRQFDEAHRDIRTLIRGMGLHLGDVDTGDADRISTRKGILHDDYDVSTVEALRAILRRIGQDA